MTYTLKYKRPNGAVAEIADDGAGNPFATRERAAIQVLRVFPQEGIKIGIADAKRFGCLVRDAEVGEDVTHEPSGLVFRTVDANAW